MARPWEYTRARRILMQGSLCAALGLTLVLAWSVDRSKAAALAVSLGPAQSFPNAILSINLRLPVGWKVEKVIQPGAAMVEVVDHKAVGTRRLVQIELQRIHRGPGGVPTPEMVASQNVDGRVPRGPPHPFDFLGHPGIFIEYPVLPDHADGENISAMSPPLLYAGTVLPESNVAISVRMESSGQFAPADIALLKSIAESLAIADGPHPAATLPSSPEPDLIEQLPEQPSHL